MNGQFKNKQQILLLEDEMNLQRGISLKLEKEGYHVFATAEIAEGIKIFEENQINLIICDITLEDGNGVDFCRSIRTRSTVHFIFLTALDQEIDIVMGYEAGADDYITKPFSLAVLISKVNAIFKRVGIAAQEKLESGSIAVHKNEMKVLVNNKEVVLTKTEWKMLILLMENAKQILSKQQILEVLFDIDGDFVEDNTIAVNIRRLREKIEDNPSEPIYIKNVRGLGYIWNKECRKY